MSQKFGGNLRPKLPEVAPDFDSRFGGIEATENYCPPVAPDAMSDHTPSQSQHVRITRRYCKYTETRSVVIAHGT